MADIGDCVGQMDAEWINEQLSDFTYTFDDSDGEFVTKMNLLSRTYNMTADDLISDLIAFATNARRSCLDVLFLNNYESSVLTKKADQRCADDNVMTPQPTRTVLGEKTMIFDHEESPDLDASGYIKEIESESASLNKKYVKFTPDRKAASSMSYQNRKNKGKVVISRCGKHWCEGKKVSIAKKIAVEMCSDKETEVKSRYGIEKSVFELEEICSHIDFLSDLIHERNPEIVFEQYDTVSSEPFFICGQIVDESGEHLSSSTCSIQSTDDSGFTLNLDLSRLASYSLFPGKVVAMMGINESGTNFTPVEILEPPLMSAAPVNVQEGIGSLSIWCAVGPFTSSDTFSFEQLCDFLELAVKEVPDVIILMGPFIDSTSKIAHSSSLGRTYAELFEILLLNICDTLRVSKPRLIIVPSKRDATVLPLIPVAPFEISKECKKNLYEEMTFTPDPALVKIAGIQFALSNSEILQHLGRDEIYSSENSENEDRIARLMGHLIRQRSLYPLYPPPPDCAESASGIIRASRLSQIPHIIILSSMLAPMVKTVDGCLCINMNALARGAYLKVDINLAALTDSSRDGTVKNVYEYCNVNVVRL